MREILLAQLAEAEAVANDIEEKKAQLLAWERYSNRNCHTHYDVEGSESSDETVMAVASVADTVIAYAGESKSLGDGFIKAGLDGLETGSTLMGYYGAMRDGVNAYDDYEKGMYSWAYADAGHLIASLAAKDPISKTAVAAFDLGLYIYQNEVTKDAQEKLENIKSTCCYIAQGEIDHLNRTIFHEKFGLDIMTDRMASLVRRDETGIGDFGWDNEPVMAANRSAKDYMVAR